MASVSLLKHLLTQSYDIKVRFRLSNVFYGNSRTDDVDFKGSSDPNHFIFGINVGKSRIRHTTTLKLNNEFLDRLKIDSR